MVYLKGTLHGRSRQPCRLGTNLNTEGPKGLSPFVLVAVPQWEVARREVPEPADRRLKHVECTSRNAMDCFITENLVLPVMYDSVQSVLVKQHGCIQWTNCSKNTLLGN